MSETATGFYIYEDVPTRKATLHHGDCYYCNHGQGRQPSRNERQNWWSARFDTAEAGRSAPIRASSVLHDCAKCMV
jgi:hypothetical protein